MRNVFGLLHRIIMFHISISSHFIFLLTCIADMLDDVIKSLFLCLTAINFVFLWFFFALSRFSDELFWCWLIVFVVYCVVLQLHMEVPVRPGVQKSYSEFRPSRQWWCFISSKWRNKVQGRTVATSNMSLRPFCLLRVSIAVDGPLYQLNDVEACFFLAWASWCHLHRCLAALDRLSALWHIFAIPKKSWRRSISSGIFPLASTTRAVGATNVVGPGGWCECISLNRVDPVGR